MKMRLNKKPIFLASITVLAFTVLIWQWIALFHNDIRTPSITSTTSPHQKNQREASSVPTSHIQEVSTPTLSNNDTPEQKAYITLLNRYQLAKMQHKLLQEELAIANARQKITEFSHKNTLEMPHPLSGFGTENTGMDQDTAFDLVYLGFQNNHWSATIRHDGHYQELENGTSFTDGTQVIEIDKNGVSLQKGKQRYRLTFTAMTPLASPETVTEKQTPITVFAKTPPALKPKITQQVVEPLQPQPTSTIQFSKKSHTLDETVLLEMPPSSYTIKLMADNDKNHLLNFARKYHIEDRALCYSHGHAPKNQFTLVYGDYLTTRAALTALENLPRELREHYLTIQRLEHIQHEIRG